MQSSEKDKRGKRFMKDERIAVFPIDEDFLSLPNNHNIQLGRECHQISYYITLAGWNIENKEIQLHTLEKFNFENIDTFVLINSFRKLEDEVIHKIVSVAAENEIKVICARDDIDINQEMLKRECLKKNIAYEFVSEETSLVESRLINNIEVPIVTISGVGPYVGKFEVGLYLRNSFEGAGYKTLFISSRREGKIFGAHIFPEYMYNKNLDYTTKVYEFNSYVNSLVKEEKPDIVLIGVPGEMMELSERHLMNFGIMASIVFNAIKPDVSILNMYNMRYTDEFLEEQRKFCKYRFGMIPDLFYATFTSVIDSSLKEVLIRYFQTDRLFDDLLEKYNLFSETDVKKGLLFKQIVDILEEYGSLEVL